MFSQKNEIFSTPLPTFDVLTPSEDHPLHLGNDNSLKKECADHCDQMLNLKVAQIFAKVAQFFFAKVAQKVARTVFT